MTRLLATWIIAAVCCVPGWAATLESPGILQTGISAQPLSSALKALNDQCGRQCVAYADSKVEDRQSHAVQAGTTFVKALCAMLEGTGLTFEPARDGYTLKVGANEPEPCADEYLELPPVDVTGSLTDNCQIEIRCSEDPDPAGPGDPFTPTRDWEDREKDGDSGIDRTARLLPGLDWTQLSSVGGNIYTILAIYGVIDRHGNTTGIWWDHIPLPAATSNSFARAIPYNFDNELTPKFGPQPVLLGANAQSGAIEYMPTQPDLQAYSGQLRSEWAITRGGDPTRELGAAWGGPLEPDKLAFRVSGWYRTEGGFVDRVDPFAPGYPVVDRNSNELTMESARLALRYHPSESVTLIPSFVYQSTIGHDSPAFMLWEDPAMGRFSAPGAGRFLNGSLIRQPISDSFRLASLRAFFNFGSIRMESITGYVRRLGAMTSDDATSKRWHCLDVATPLCEYPTGPDDLVTTRVNLTQRSITQQVQLVRAGETTTWLLGAFFADLHSREIDRVFADPVPATIQFYYDLLESYGQSVPDDFFWRVPTTIDQRQFAGFTQVSRDLLDKRLTVSAGVRVEYQRVRAEATAPTDGSIPDDTIDFMKLREPIPDQTRTVVAPQLTLTYRPRHAEGGRDQEFYVYRTIGYAPGNVDAARPTCREPPTVYPSDKLHSIQVGTRQAWGDGRRMLEFELFQLDWDNGPQAWRTCLFMHLPGKARSRGLRFNAGVAPFGGAIRAGLEATYVDARYRETIRNDYPGRVTDTGEIQAPDDAILVRKGDALGTPPQVIAPWNVKLTLEKDFSLFADHDLTLRLIDTWHSRNAGPFYTEDPEAKYMGNLQPDPANNLLDVRAILTRGAVNVDLYVANVLDSRPVLSKRNKGNDQSTLFYATTFRPRTFGLSVNWNINGKK